MCGSQFSVEHAITCVWWFQIPSVLIVTLLTEVCHNVRTEPKLQPLTGETFSRRSANTEGNSRLDIRAQGFWGDRRQDTFLDVRVYNLHAPSNRLMTPSACYWRPEKEKRRMYDQRVWEVEHSTSAPLVFSATGGMGPTAGVFYRRLAGMIAERSNQQYKDGTDQLPNQLFPPQISHHVPERLSIQLASPCWTP